MSEFPNALDLVYSTLRELREQGVELRASADALERLANTRTVAPVSTPTAAPPAAAVAAPVAPTPKPASEPVKAAARVSETAPVSHYDGPRMAPLEGSKAERLAAMRGPVLACTKCPHLVKSRTQVVFGVGNPEAELMFVGEAPGEDEDRQGEPFVGKAGQLLTKIIETMGFARGDVYIANVLKCRPDMPPGMPGNRKPKVEEMQTCLPYLREQIDIIRPRLLVALGATAMEGLTGSTDSMSRLRGRWHDFHGTPLMATYHPAYLLRNQSLSEKRKVWEDMLMVLERLGKMISEKQRNYFLSK
ncbi:phage SPO1 DNA polymerase-related protein [Chthoniobacter flavus Ellin428]|uniref:Type-4 uracil-DNA glycosylase n=1 Tax=Chthoniobacter flavus Ellin428 TaxID=497964 RepID=B4CUQ5_9BACT|nr:uracil-DNA glycosylase [Chthoniobacter flavus]EDY22293.1 phage SPO1 DNA polymerase-related protein [Chthoniobacter flavus Ellin428]TCO94690.1 DNA polymerase [Chthoniobacter flavus]